MPDGLGSGCSRSDAAGAHAYVPRNGYDMSRRHQHITSALTTVPAERFGLDGELVVLDDDGRSNGPEKNLSLLKQTQEEAP
jgi:hypothetical protein